MNDASVSLPDPGLQLLGGTASTAAQRADPLFVAMLLLCGGMALLIGLAVLWFGIRYRKGSNADRTAPPSNNKVLELTWTIAPVVLFMGIFAWGAYDFIQLYEPPADALPVYVIGKQWMWQLQHPNGRREIDELHVPLGQAVRLIMTSQDIIHSFSVPAFRLKQDVLPGRYTALWFRATELGQFHLFCAEYCGAEHSAMLGKVVVMQPAEYARWLDQGPKQPSLVEQGFALFRNRGCAGCHDPASTVHAPLLSGLIGRTVRLQDGRSVVADENYVRDSILQPQKDVVAGFAPIMPSFAGQLGEQEIQALIAWLRSTDATANQGATR